MCVTCADACAVFVWNDWVKAAKGAPWNFVSVPAGGAPGADRVYTLRVHTADARGAGTDSDVSVVLIDDAGRRSAELPLTNSANNFERGRVDEFTVNIKVCVLRVSRDFQPLLLVLRVGMSAACALTAVLQLAGDPLMRSATTFITHPSSSDSEISA
jgi:PLAT/LH2 domain